eukprot:COSAG06_NODE_2217_length_7324_cov_7.546298_12_plen_163_part_00
MPSGCSRPSPARTRAQTVSRAPPRVADALYMPLPLLLARSYLRDSTAAAARSSIFTARLALYARARRAARARRRGSPMMPHPLLSRMRAAKDRVYLTGGLGAWRDAGRSAAVKQRKVGFFEPSQVRKRQAVPRVDPPRSPRDIALGASSPVNRPLIFCVPVS